MNFRHGPHPGFRASASGLLVNNDMRYQRIRRLAVWVLLGWVGWAPPNFATDEASVRIPVGAEQRDAAVRELQQSDFAKGGADTCLACHGEYYPKPILPFFRTKHANPADPRSPMAQHQCETCHGPGGRHAVLRLRRGEQRPPMLAFGKDAWTPPQAQNEVCLSCHRDHSRIQWEGSSHQFNEVPCAACHQVHSGPDPVLDDDRQPQVCYQCHKHQRAQFAQVSHHPVGEGRMACADCHDPHRSDGDFKVKATLRETCTGCHAEKRGPFLWEHAPAAEDCGLCHQPHGTSQPALLRRRPPQLCQECHSQVDHPGVGYDGSFATASRFVTAKGCLNCHGAVHGSNHPSGVSLTR